MVSGLVCSRKDLWRRNIPLNNIDFADEAWWHDNIVENAAGLHTSGMTNTDGSKWKQLRRSRRPTKVPPTTFQFWYYNQNLIRKFLILNLRMLLLGQSSFLTSQNWLDSEHLLKLMCWELLVYYSMSSSPSRFVQRDNALQQVYVPNQINQTLRLYHCLRVYFKGWRVQSIGG